MSARRPNGLGARLARLEMLMTRLLIAHGPLVMAGDGPQTARLLESAEAALMNRGIDAFDQARAEDDAAQTAAVTASNLDLPGTAAEEA